MARRRCSLLVRDIEGFKSFFVFSFFSILDSSSRSQGGHHQAREALRIQHGRRAIPTLTCTLGLDVHVTGVWFELTS